MECVRCFSPNEQHRRFCGHCGAPLSSVCPRCSFINRVVDKFCGGCGEGLAAHFQAAEPRVAAQPAQPAPLPRQATGAPATPPIPAVRRVPAAAPGAPPATRGPESLSKQDLTDLLKPAPAPTTPSLPQKVSQDDLDNLFAK